MVEECKRGDPHGGGCEQARTDGVGGQGGEKRWRIDLDGRERNRGVQGRPWKIKNILKFPAGE